MTIREDLIKQKTKCGKLLGGECKICGCVVNKRGMVIHHRWYIVNDVIYKHYPKNDKGRLQYYIDLNPLIKACPRRFSYLCNVHHHALQKLIRYSDKILKPLLRERIKSITHK